MAPVETSQAAIQWRKDVGLRDKAKDLKGVAAHGAERLRKGELLQQADFQLLKDAAIEASGVASRKGEVKGWRVARAAITPRGTASRVVRGVGNEALRQYRSDADTSDGEGPSVGRADRLFKAASAARRDGNDEDALTYLTDAIRLEPHDGMLYAVRAQSLESLGRLAESLADWDTALSYYPEDDLFYQRRGDLYQMMGRYDAAIKDYHRAAVLDPADEVHARCRDDMVAKLQATGSTHAQSTADAQPSGPVETEKAEETLGSFDAEWVSTPEGKTLYHCSCRVTDRRVSVTDRNGNTRQCQLSDIVGVRVDGLVSKMVKIDTREGCIALSVQKQVAQQLPACLRRAMAG